MEECKSDFGVEKLFSVLHEYCDNKSSSIDSLKQTITEKYRTDVNETDKCGQTPLYWACSCGFENIAKVLIECGADVNRVTIALIHVRYGPPYDGGISQLSKRELGVHEGDMTHASITGGNTPLNVACCRGYKPIVELLLTHGADPNKTNAIGAPPLFIACLNDHKSIVELLLACGADVNKADKDGCTPLFMACANNHKAIVELLLAYGADANKTDKDGWTPLNVAYQRGWNDIIELLITQGHIDINKADDCGETLLYRACSNGRKAVVEILLKHGADVNKDDGGEGWVPIEMAFREGHKDIVKLLISTGKCTPGENLDSIIAACK